MYVALIESVTALIGASEQLAPEPVRTDPPVEERSPDASRWTNTVGMEFVLIPDGIFQMGSEDGQAHEQPVHTVRISQPYYLGVTPVTQAQWEEVVGDNPSEFKGDTNCPVEWVSWEDVQTFISKLEERELGVRYRLPTEAEWEYAATADDPAVDPSGPAAGADRVVRGGSWVDLARNCRSLDRGGRGPGYRSPRVGFRVLRLV